MSDVNDYEWAVDALVEANALLNKQECQKALDVIRTALWNAAGSCGLSCEPKGTE